MVKITDLVTPQNLVEFYENSQPEETLGDSLFPADKQLGLKLDFIKGSNNKPVVLKASEFDTQASLRDRMPIKLTTEDMPLFDEGMLVKEADRQQLNLLGDNTQIREQILNRIFNDNATLIDAAKARVESMRMRVLATGRLEIDSNGVKQTFDYGMKEENQGTASVDWSDPASNPLEDIDKATETATNNGLSIAGMVLNNKTFGQIRNNDNTARAINGAKNKPATRTELLNFLEEEYGLSVAFVNETYINDDGEVAKYFPDGYVTFVPDRSVGRTVYGTTPEESDLMSGNNQVQVSIVNTGVAVATETHTNPVNVETLVTMITLPSFEGADLVYQLQTDLSAEDPVEPEDPETGE